MSSISHRFTNNGEYDRTLRVSENWLKSEEYWAEENKQDAAVFLEINGDHWVTFGVEQAREIAAAIIEIADKVDSLKPKVKTFAEKLEEAPMGTRLNHASGSQSPYIKTKLGWIDIYDSQLFTYSNDDFRPEDYTLPE